MTDDPITEEWLKSVGFKWHQFDRQPDKHWLLWLGGGLKERPSRRAFDNRNSSAGYADDRECQFVALLFGGETAPREAYLSERVSLLKCPGQSDGFAVLGHLLAD